MKIKVCGMREAQNISDVAALQPDFLGFIFAPKSPRFVAQTLAPETLESLPENIVKTGVFVNADTEEIFRTAECFALNAIQLHGNETPDFCRKIREKGFLTIKAFGISETTDFSEICRYENVSDLFIFDTKCASDGGSGQKFPWEILQHYAGKTPFFLSGGIGADDAERILSFAHPEFFGIDLNSRFEDAPAMKNIQKLTSFIHKIRNNNF